MRVDERSGQGASCVHRWGLVRGSDNAKNPPFSTLAVVRSIPEHAAASPGAAFCKQQLPHCESIPYCSCVLYVSDDVELRGDDIVDCGMRNRRVVE
jgi:hypothetical protein